MNLATVVVFLSTIFIIKESKSMAKSKSAQTYELLKKNQAQLYEDFFHIHQLFSQDQAQYRQEFNRLGQDFVHWVRLYEKRLCGGMERSGHGAYSSSVADTYWKLVRKDFPLIDQVGIIFSS